MKLLRVTPIQVSINSQLISLLQNFITSHKNPSPCDVNLFNIDAGKNVEKPGYVTFIKSERFFFFIIRMGHTDFHLFGGKISQRCHEIQLFFIDGPCKSYKDEA